MLSRDLLCELFDYRDGSLYWRVAKAQRVKVGDLAGTLSGSGYWYTSINNKVYSIHRLIFMMHYGYLPPTVDHINGDITDNRIENLRPATRSQNARNSKLRSDNSSGCSGVYWHSQLKKWRVLIAVSGKTKHFGCFETFEAAKEVATTLRKELHGEFCRNHREHK